jgi:hypothetical protein
MDSDDGSALPDRTVVSRWRALGRIQLDAFSPSRAAQLDVWQLALRWVVQEQRPFSSHHLQSVTLRHRGAAVEEREDVAGEAERATEDGIGALSPERGRTASN